MNIHDWVQQHIHICLLLIILAIGFFFRFIMIQAIRLDYDEGIFMYIAYRYHNVSLWNGINQNFHYFFDIPLNQPPIVSIFYVILYKIFPFSYIYGRLANVFISTLIILVMYFTSKELFNDKNKALLSSLAIALDPTLSMAILINLDAITGLMFVLSVYVTILAIKRNDNKYHIIAGVVFGISMLTKWTLAIIPISYVVFYIFYQYKLNELVDKKYLTKLSLAIISALIVFLPWFLLMYINGILPVLFVHASRFNILTSLNDPYKTWLNSPILVILGMISFIYIFVEIPKYRFFLIYGLLIIYPFYLIMPRFNDYSIVLYLFVLLSTEILYVIFSDTIKLLIKLKNSNYNLNAFQIDLKQIYSVVFIILIIFINSGIVIEQAGFQRDHTVQNVASYLKKTTNTNVTIIATPEFGVLLLPRPYINVYDNRVVNNSYLIYDYRTHDQHNLTIGVQNGVLNQGNINYNFSFVKRINDVVIYYIAIIP